MQGNPSTIAAPSSAASTSSSAAAGTGEATPAGTPPGKGKSRHDGHGFQVVGFRLGDEHYGVDIMSVQEILLLGVVTQVPEVPEHVLGVINLRGNVIPLLSLRRRFAMADAAVTDTTRIVVMNLRGRTVGVVVDGVSEVLRLQRDEVGPPPASLTGAGKDYVIGLAHRKERLLILLDMARLLIGSELAAATDANQGNV